MKKPPPIPMFKKERKKTDDSLIAERDKTNESLTKSKLETERQTDKQVQRGRLQSDQAKKESRNLADSVSNQGKQDQVTTGELVVERERADSAMEKERTQIDLAIDQEREKKRLLADQLLAQERELTDQNLSAERTRADSEVHQKVDLLSEEISAHSETKKSLSTRDEFLAIVSHDLKNPIGAASLCAEFLLQDAAFQEFGSEARSSIELIKRNVDTSLRLIADLLDMERIEGGKLQLNSLSQDIGQIIGEVVESFKHIALAKTIELKTAEFSTVGKVLCDKDRVMQVLSNLIGNALKFTPEGGSVTIGRIVNEKTVQVSVSDTGPGIPEEKRFQIFERHTQLGVSTRVGLGLGLFISKRLIEAHGGHLWVDSTLGQGSTFIFTIPRSALPK